MRVVLSAVTLLLLSIYNIGAYKYRAYASKGLKEYKKTRDLDFFIPAGSCSAEITSDLFGNHCHDPEFVYVEIRDDAVTDIIHVNDSLTEASIWRRPDEKQECPTEAPVLVTVMCNHNRRSDIDFDEKLPRRRLKPAKGYANFNFDLASNIRKIFWNILR